MQYCKIFYTGRPLPAGAEPDFILIMSLNFAFRDEALKEAFKRIFSGAIVREIEVPEGFYLDRAKLKDCMGYTEPYYSV